MSVNDEGIFTSRKTYVVPPCLRDLSSWPGGGNASRPFHMWEVSTPPKLSISWSVVLSYVIASSGNTDWQGTLLGSDRDIQDLMAKRKISPQKLNFRSIRKQIAGFNPFKNQHSFYYTKDVISVVRMFDLRLKRFANKMRTGADEWSDVIKLRAAAKMLDCCLEVYETDSEGNKQSCTVYAPTQQPIGKERMVMFQHSRIPKELKRPSGATPEQEEKTMNVFRFGMSLEHVMPLRRDTLGYILKRAKLSQKDIGEIQRSFNYDGNFLIFLLKNSSWHNSIPLIYASPYIAWKLAAAGFNTDPCSLKQSEYSAFYYCIALDSTRIIYVLYDFASNSFRLSEKTTRNPDLEVITSVTAIGQTLQTDYDKSKAFSNWEKRKYTALNTFHEILRFNEYQRGIISEINTLQTNSSLQSKHPLSRYAPAQRIKLTFMLILETYSRYFHISPDDNAPICNSRYVEFQNFIKYSEYYENMDKYTCLLLFDNCLLLNLPTDTSIFRNTVHSLFLTVFGYELFPKCRNHGAHCSKCALTAQNSALRFIPFSFRLNFVDSVKALLAELKSTPDEDGNSSSSSKEHDPSSNMDIITASLKDLPEIKDEFLIRRLKRYLDIARDVPICGDDLKGVLTVERALQVIGETLNTSESSSVIGHLLCSCLPKDAVAEIFRIRNHCLSKYRPRTMQGKLVLEKEILRFRKLQEVIQQVDCLVNPVYVSQELRIHYFMNQKGLRECKGVDKTLQQDLRIEQILISYSRHEIYKRHKGKFKVLTYNLLNYVQDKIDGDTHKKIATLKFLFAFLVKHCDKENQGDVQSVLRALDDLSQTHVNQASIQKRSSTDIPPEKAEEMIRVFSLLRACADKLFTGIKEERCELFDFSGVGAFFADARKFNWFTDGELSIIKEKIHEHLNLSRTAKESLKGRLRNGPQPTPRQAQKLIGDIFTTQKNRTSIESSWSTNPNKSLKILDTIRGDEKDTHLRRDVRDEKFLDDLVSFIKLEEGGSLLLRIDFSGDLRRKVLEFMNRKVELLLDRIGHLKAILVDGDEEISELLKWGRSGDIKAHTRYLMAQRYWRERDVRASLEMLLFDCMNILKTKQSLKRLWTKTNNLFSGASLRDVLSHGSTILETVGGLLDKDDVPSHFIDKMLELIEDGDALRTLSGLWERSKLTSLKQFEDIFKGHADRDPLLRKWMQRRSDDVGGWKDYLTLLPLK